ncbi:PLP-dependent transferase [Candidatus Vidania fulgoroideorum]
MKKDIDLAQLMKLGTKFNCYSPPIVKRTTIFFKNFKKLASKIKKGKQVYGLENTLIAKELSRIICKIEGGKYCVLVPSGLSSIFVSYLSFLKKGDGVLIPENVYYPNYNSLVFLSKKLGLKIFTYSPFFKRSKILKICIEKKVRLLFIESPGSITFEVPDINFLISISKKLGLITVFDNTYSCGIVFKPLKLGIDISIQALTKFYSGSNDVFMGAIITRKNSIYKKIKKTIKSMGLGIQNEDCYLILRGIHNINHNFKSSEKKAYKIALLLKKLPFVRYVMHPSLKGSSSYKNWKNLYKGSSGLVTFAFNKYICKKKIYNFVNNLKCFRLGYSWGGAISLVMIYENLHLERPYMKKYKGYRFIRLYTGSERYSSLSSDIIKSFNKFIIK